jgi:hypothetical protein
MWFLLATLPWVVAVGALLYIVIQHSKKLSESDDEDLYEESLDEEIIKDTIHVAVYEDKAYWVHENIFYEADLISEPDFTTARPIDTMSLNTKQITELMEVLDELEDHRKE